MGCKCRCKASVESVWSSLDSTHRGVDRSENATPSSPVEMFLTDNSKNRVSTKKSHHSVTAHQRVTGQLFSPPTLSEFRPRRTHKSPVTGAGNARVDTSSVMRCAASMHALLDK